MALIRSRIIVSARVCCMVKFESSLKSTVASGVTTLPKIESASRNTCHFPWRERPNEGEGSWIKNQTFNVARIIFDSQNGKKACLKDEEIVEAAASAFAACLNGVFQHNLVDNVCLRQSKEKDGTAQSDSPVLSKNEVPLLNDILESKLAQFYENAILKCCINRQDLGYMLISAETPQIVDKEFVIGSSRYRQASKSPMGLAAKNFGVVIDSEVQLKDYFMKKADASGFISVRYWLDIPCEEVFFVKGKSGDNILQGSTEPQHVTHQILLENSFEFNHDKRELTKGEEDWSIVDLDDWMRGNIFWAQSKKHEDE